MCTTPFLNLLGIQNEGLRKQKTGGKHMPPPVLNS
jgi:hypothetical protein